ncbi:helix-turn-helix domain-containing protein [Sphingomonas sp. UBA978]|uniref:helix-turn-helix domain-containing protein n=1 Tax=Sphingomonas sp. UBA978 TaxID=1947536 RepID=UPI0025D468F1|nr:helix-turn-helix domain-containing protein [Sphingomonas sp. UBA978]
MQGHIVNDGPLTCTINDAARQLGVSRRTIYSLIEVGRLNKLKAGRRSLIPTADLRAFAAGGV